MNDLSNARIFVLTGFAGTRLVGKFDTYVETSVDLVLGWYSKGSTTSCGYIDFFLEDGPMVQLYAEEGMPLGWDVQPLEDEVID